MIFVTTVSFVTVTNDKSASSTMIVGRATGPQFPSPSHVVLVTEDVIRGASGLVMVDKTVVRVVTCVVPHNVTDGRSSHDPILYPNPRCSGPAEYEAGTRKS